MVFDRQSSELRGIYPTHVDIFGSSVAMVMQRVMWPIEAGSKLWVRQAVCCKSARDLLGTWLCNRNRNGERERERERN